MRAKDSIAIEYEDRLKDAMEYNEIFRGYQQKLQCEKDVLQGMFNDLKIRYYEKLINSDYKLWSTQDIVFWIINLNQAEYGMYGEVLLRNMMIRDIDGSCLEELNTNVLRELGVWIPRHWHNIYKEIQALISKQRTDNANTLDGNGNKECVVCMDKAGDYACVPCGHLCLCDDCKDNVDRKCPVCRKRCDCIIKIFQ